jgi:hypothetical protein
VAEAMARRRRRHRGRREKMGVCVGARRGLGGESGGVGWRKGKGTTRPPAAA